MRSIKLDFMTLEQGKPKIAIPVTGRDHDEISEQCKALLSKPCDIVEWRVDHYLAGLDDLEENYRNGEIHLEMIRILDDIDYITNGKPVIFTIRTKKQGGKISFAPEKIRDLASLAAQSGLVEFVDLELFNEQDELNEADILKSIGEIHEFGARVILSYHDFAGMPSGDEIINIVNAMRGLGADISKVAGTAADKNDAVMMLKTAYALTEGDQDPVIMIAMGKEGIVSRIAGGRFGSCITFAAGRNATAPGQIDADDLNRLMTDYYNRESGSENKQA